MDNEAILSVSLKDYKKKIEELRSSLLSLEDTSEEYQKTAEKIREMQAKLNEVMSVGKESVNAVAGSYNALSQQLSALKKEWKNMEIGTQQWKDTAKEIDSLNNQLKNADASVGVYSRNVGNYSQSFVEAFSKVGGSAGKMSSSIVSGAKAAGTALKTLAANPIGAVIAAVALVVNGLVQAFKRNEEATNSLRKAMVPFKVVMVEVQKVFDVLATSIGKAAESLGNFLSKIFGSKSGASQLRKELASIADDEAKLAKQQRETTRKNADAENEIAELRYKAAQKSKYTEEERLGFLTQAGEKEKEIAKRAYEDLKLQYEIIKRKNELTKSSAEDLQAEADAYAAMVQAETNYYNKTKEIESQISEIRNKDLDKVKEIVKRVKEASQTEIQNLKAKYEEEKKLLKKYHKDTTELTIQYNNKVREIQEKAFMDSYNKSLEYYERLKNLGSPAEQMEMDYEQLKDKLDEFTEVMNTGWKDAENTNKTITKEMMEGLDGLRKYGVTSERELYVQYQEIKKQFVDLETEIKKNDFEKWAKTKESNLQDLAEGSSVYFRELYKYYRDYLNKMMKYPDEDDIDFEIRQKNIKKAADEALALSYTVQAETIKAQAEQKIMFDRANDWIYKSPHTAFGEIVKTYEGLTEEMEKRLNAARYNYFMFYNDIQKYGKIELGIDLDSAKSYEELQDMLNELFNSIPPEMKDEYIGLLNDYMLAEKEVLAQRRQNWIDLANGIGDIMGSMADLYEQDIENQVNNGKLSEAEAQKEYKRVQGMKISQAVIQTISGALAAFMGCQELGQPWGLVLGAAQAAAVTAAGVAQINQLKSQNPYGGSSSISSPAVVTPKLNEYSPEGVTNMTSLSDERNLQSMLEKTNIYVRVSDIDNAQKKGRVRVRESSF